MKKLFYCLPATLLLITSVGCGTTSQQTSTNNSFSEITTEVITEVSETTTEELKDKNIAIGEAGTLGNWEITVTSFNIVDEVPNSYGSFVPDDGSKYAVASIHIENKGKNADTFLPSYGLNSDVRAKIAYGDGYEFSATQLMGYDKDLHNNTLNPLSSVDGEIAFELPETVVNDSGELIISFTQDINELNIKVR